MLASQIRLRLQTLPLAPKQPTHLWNGATLCPGTQPPWSGKSDSASCSKEAWRRQEPAQKAKSRPEFSFMLMARHVSPTCMRASSPPFESWVYVTTANLGLHLRASERDLKPHCADSKHTCKVTGAGLLSTPGGNRLALFIILWLCPGVIGPSCQICGLCLCW